MAKPSNAAPQQRSLRRMAVLAVITTVVVGTAGCESAKPSTKTEPSTSATASSSAFSVRDAWVKASDNGMTGAFGTLVNDGNTDITVVSAASAVSATMELHEVAMRDGKMVMRPKNGGFIVKARSSHMLEPGADHLMLMNLTAPIKHGDQVIITLTLADGRTAGFTATAKPFTGAGESYSPSAQMSMKPAA